MDKGISVNIKDIMRVMPKEKDAKKAMYRAFSRASGPARTVAAKEVSAKYHVKRQDVRDIDFVKRNPSEPSVNIVWEGAQMPLDKFETTFPKTNHRFKARGRANSPQVTTMIRKSGRRARYNTSFVANLKGENRVYRRTTRKRFPIKRTLGPAIPQLLNSVELHSKIIKRVQPIIDKRTVHEINRILAGKK